MQVNECTELFAEIFTVQLCPDTVPAFMEEGKKAHAYFSGFAGYKGTDLVLLKDSKVKLVLYWNSYTLFDEQLPAIMNACPVKGWFANSQQISHQPGIVLSYTSRQQQL